MSVNIRSKDIVFVPIEKIVPNEKNRNKHSKDQIDRLVKIIKYQGFRSPMIVSNQSGLLVSGHGRLLAAKQLGMKNVPVIYQDFENSDQEYAAMVSENSIAIWAELDLGEINDDLADLGPDFDIDMLGIEDFELEPADKASDVDRLRLSDRFLLPPFSVLNAREGWWQDRKRQWIALGIKSELGRGGAASSELQKPGTLGCIPPNQNMILKRKGNYA